MRTVTADQVRDLWVASTNPNASLDRGDKVPPVTVDDIRSLIDGSDVDTDDQGNPTGDMWEVLAAHLNSEVGQQLDDQAERRLQRIRDSREELDQARHAAHRAELDYRQAVQEAFPLSATKLPLSQLADAAGVSRQRLYQIRDDHR